MKKVYYTLVTLIFSIVCIFILNKGVYASSATISASKTTNVKKDESVTINAKVNSASAWELDVSSSGGNLTKSEDRTGTTNSGNNESQTVKLGTFKADSIGTYTITLSGYVVDGTDLTKKTASGSLTITVVDETPAVDNTNNNQTQKPQQNDEQPKSSDATLKSLTVKEGTLNKKFSATTTEYSMSVDSDVEKITITAEKNHSAAKVSINGNKNLKVGTNTVSIVVTAEDGTKKTYKIKVSKQASEDEIQSNPEEEEVQLFLKSLTIAGVKLDKDFKTDTYNYSCSVRTEVDKLDIKAVANLQDAIVEITGNEELKFGENIINILVKSKDGNKIVTYQIIVTKEGEKIIEPVAQVSATVETPQEVVYPRWNTTQKVLITLFTSIIAAMGIMYAVIEYRYTNNKEDNKENDDDFLEPYSFGKIGFKKEEKNTKKEDKAKEKPTKKTAFEEIDSNELTEDEEETSEEIEDDQDEKSEKIQFEKIEEEKPKNNKGKHF